MKERPILFSGPMVRALRDGSKTQTRRVVKPQPIENARFVGGYYVPGPKRTENSKIAVEAPYVHLTCPYGQPGDRLAVRETFYAWGRWETRYSAKKGRDEWHFVDMTLECGRSYAYDTDEDTPMIVTRRSTVVPLWWRRPAIFMPRAASRITLEITRVRVERLQDISSRDAIAEGIEACPIGGEWRNYLDSAPNRDALTPRVSFRSLWESINGPDSWAANPWVWRVEFRRLP
ncbi:hypothetical protein ACTJKQ_14200 [Acidovorax sp. 22279]|uniref:hypothetical protein n=1 Tax=Acidovorax sp. 22279 TaxID=3453900 RepID=UPI003F83EEDF